MNTRPPELKGFDRFLQRFLVSVKQWLFFMLYLMLFRLAFILFFRNRIEPSTASLDVFLTAINGLRYDSMVVTNLLFLPFLMSIAPASWNLDRLVDRIRIALHAAFVVVTAAAWIITFSYFKEYGEQFNYVIFNLYYDDTGAIFKTIWADYHPIPTLLSIALISALTLVLQKRYLRTGFPASLRASGHRYPLLFKIATIVLVLVLVAAGSRGSIGRRPAQRKDAAVSTDPFLNKTVVNPYFSLRFAVQDHAQQTGLAGLESYLPDRDVRKAAQQLFRKPEPLADLDAYLEKRSKGHKAAPPRHIFLVVMESYDAWPFLKKYASLGLTENLSRLAKQGLHFTDFVPASDGTMQSLTAIITGIPYSHVEINYQMTARTPYPSSLFATFKKMGYRTRVFYGGYLSWQRFGDFARDQGAEEIYGAPHMSKGAATREWGVDDEFLFNFVSDTVDDRQPSFNVIMTTSYHPPYNIDVRAKGFPLTAVPPDVTPYFDGTTSLTMLGHLWYSDKCLGDFVRTIEGRLSRPLFAFTGDHYGRKFINAKPDFFERSGVPFILYGSDVLRGLRIPQGAAGSHIDISTTLIELTAPKGFSYYSVGQDLLTPREDFFGVGFFRVIGKDFILELSNPPQFHPLPGRPLPAVLPDAEYLISTLNRTYGIGWWRVRHGAMLEKPL